jgi:hypothetical protein
MFENGDRILLHVAENHLSQKVGSFRLIVTYRRYPLGVTSVDWHSCEYD